MSSQIYSDKKKSLDFYPTQDPFATEPDAMGWPKGTWFQKRLRYVRQQQRKRGTETEFVYECPLGTIRFRQSNAAD